MTLCALHATALLPRRRRPPLRQRLRLRAAALSVPGARRVSCGRGRATALRSEENTEGTVAQQNDGYTDNNKGIATRALPRQLA